MLATNIIHKIEEFWDLQLNQDNLRSLTGGDTNKSYFADTSIGKCVIKNINILQYIRDYQTSREELFQSINFVENVAKIQNGNVVCAVEGKKGFFLENKDNIYLLYPYKNGQALSNNEIKAGMISLIAAKLGDIHRIQKNYDKVLAQRKGERYYMIAEQLINNKIWTLFHKVSQITHLFPRLKDISIFLVSHQILFLQALQEASLNALCHNDLKPKNVLWTKENNHFWILDWETASEFDYRIDYLDTLIAWSVEYSNNHLTLNPEKACAFQEAYPLRREELGLNVYLVLLKWYFWLCFCLRKCLRHPTLVFTQLSLIQEAIDYIECIITEKELTMLK
ncbi:phosphotransferase [Legionella clemsonensis]|uniref:Phosphotransferase enzyme family protein n=1 Tax=Legionella clemsonensis TaxID=1867846 RepID=A0A222P3T7_9GAMM|nr:phosphotransferase [Legionella clemsonensis]ASQ46487.1 Phosphotransferase enzyme family protein [Legionella clemsonensis]